MHDELNKVKAALAAADAGRWDEAHNLVQDLDGAEAAWIHANLHRDEGDDANARYWYARAGRPFPLVGVVDERKAINDALSAAVTVAQQGLAGHKG